MELFDFLLTVGALALGMYFEAYHRTLTRLMAWLRSLGRRSEPAKPIKREPTSEPPEPDPLQGNVSLVESEWKTPPDQSQKYQFPKMQQPDTRFADFNRRLIIYTDKPQNLRRGQLPKHDINIFPLRVTCSTEQLDQVVKRQLRCAYPVILDRSGMFAEASAGLELNPHLELPLIKQYLAIPEDRRPVVLSWSGQTIVEQAGLTFLRYSFAPIWIPFLHFNPHLDENLAYVFSKFVGEPDEWMWFSVANMRAHASKKHRVVEEFQEILTRSAFRNRFAALWGRQDRAPKAPPPEPPENASQSSEKPADEPTENDNAVEAPAGEAQTS